MNRVVVRALFVSLTSLASLAFVGCAAEGSEATPGGESEDGSQATMDEVSLAGCSTATVRGLSLQLIAEANCLSPGSFGRYSGTGISLGSAAFPYMQASAAASLRRAVSGRGTLSINSALRTLPQQYMLYNWYRRGQCGISLAAQPGTSPHEKGLAIDTSEYSSWRSTLANHGFRWHGAGDVVHFDYTGAGARDLSGLSVRAFQRLWNRNNPSDRISEDGAYGPQTAARLARAPSGGFEQGACQSGRDSLSWDAEDLAGEVTDNSPVMEQPSGIDSRLAPDATNLFFVAPGVESLLPMVDSRTVLEGLSDTARARFGAEGVISSDDSADDAAASSTDDHAHP
jgi:hypothetical protein